MERTRYSLSFGNYPPTHEFYFLSLEELKKQHMTLKRYVILEAFEVKEIIDEKTGEVLERDDHKITLH